MSVLSKLKETRICLAAGRVTLPYPAEARPSPPGFRGRPIFDAAKCIGCAGCANNCPAREILVLDLCQEVRILQYLGRRLHVLRSMRGRVPREGDYDEQRLRDPQQTISTTSVSGWNFSWAPASAAGGASRNRRCSMS